MSTPGAYTKASDDSAERFQPPGPPIAFGYYDSNHWATPLYTDKDVIRFFMQRAPASNIGPGFGPVEPRVYYVEYASVFASIDAWRRRGDD